MRAKTGQLNHVGVYRGGAEGAGFLNIYYGEPKCQKGRLCLKDLTMDRIQNDYVKVCKSGNSCSLTITF